MKLRICRVRDNKDLALPAYQSALAAGADLLADIAEPVVLKPSERTLVPTGVALEIPAGYEVQIRPRSGLALRQGLTVLNAPGTIDADYRGEIQVLLVNLSGENATIKRGDRIAQMVLSKVERSDWEEVSQLTLTERGRSGFGSTGV